MECWRRDLKTSRVGEARTRTFPVTCRDGSRKIINFRSVTLRTGDQLVIYEDCTERQRAEEALKASEEKYRLLLSNIPAVVFRGYPDWSVEFFDDKVTELTGYDREEFNQGRLKWSDLILPEDLEESRRFFLQGPENHGGLHPPVPHPPQKR
jgi:PAS domain-containing protein